MGRSDILVGLMPSTPETRKMINSRTLSWLPSGACFINAGRGDLVDEEDLVEALDHGSLAGAALDVFETEPLSKENAEKFQGLKNLILTPHIAGVTEESNIRVSAMIAESVLYVLG